MRKVVLSDKLPKPAGPYSPAVIAGDFVCVLSNHDLLRGLADRAGLPFEWMVSADKAAHQAWRCALL